MSAEYCAYKSDAREFWSCSKVVAVARSARQAGGGEAARALSGELWPVAVARRCRPPRDSAPRVRPTSSEQPPARTRQPAPQIPTSLQQANAPSQPLQHQKNHTLLSTMSYLHLILLPRTGIRKSQSCNYIFLEQVCN